MWISEVSFGFAPHSNGLRNPDQQRRKRLVLSRGAHLLLDGQMRQKGVDLRLGRMANVVEMGESRAQWQQVCWERMLWCRGRRTSATRPYHRGAWWPGGRPKGDRRSAGELSMTPGLRRILRLAIRLLDYTSNWRAGQGENICHWGRLFSLLGLPRLYPVASLDPHGVAFTYTNSADYWRNLLPFSNRRTAILSHRADYAPLGKPSAVKLPC